MPEVSIILATHNTPRYLREAIDSVLTQSFADFELIIINDASPHAETEQIIASYRDLRIAYIKNEKNVGQVVSANLGIGHAKAPLIARIDDDDAWTDKNKLKQQVAFLKEHPDHMAVGTNIAVTDYDTDALEYKTEYPLTDEEIRQQFFSRSPFAQSSVVFRTSAFEQAGRYDEKFKRVEDFDLWMRLGKIGKLANLPEVMVKWHTPSRSNKTVAQNRFKHNLIILSIIKKYRKEYPNFLTSYLRELVRTGIFFLLQRESSIEHSLSTFYKRLMTFNLVSVLFVAAVFSLVWRAGQILTIHVPKPFETLVICAAALTALTIIVSGIPAAATRYFKIFAKRYGWLLGILLLVVIAAYLMNWAFFGGHSSEVNTQLSRIVFSLCLFTFVIYLQLVRPGLEKLSLYAIMVSPIILWLAAVPSLQYLFLDGGRLRGADNDPNYTASWICLAILIGLAMFLFDQRKQRFIGLLSAVVSLPLLIWTSSRTAIGAFTIGLLLLMILYLIQKCNITRIVSLMSVLLLIAAGISGFLLLPHNSTKTITQRLEHVPELITNPTSDGRLELAKQSVILLAQHPLGFGPAFETWHPVLITTDGRIQGTHNMFMEVALTSGVVGLLIWLIFFSRVIADAIILLRSIDFVSAALAACLVSLLLTSFFLDMFTVRWLWIILAFIVSSRYQREAANQK